MSLKYEPASVPQHIYVKWLFFGIWNLREGRGVGGEDAELVAGVEGVGFQLSEAASRLRTAATC